MKITNHTVLRFFGFAPISPNAVVDMPLRQWLALLWARRRLSPMGDLDVALEYEQTAALHEEMATRAGDAGASALHRRTAANFRALAAQVRAAQKEPPRAAERAWGFYWVEWYGPADDVADAARRWEPAEFGPRGWKMLGDDREGEFTPTTIGALIVNPFGPYGPR